MNNKIRTCFKHSISIIVFWLFSTGCNALDIQDFIAEADLRDLEVSPDGRHVAAVWNNGDTRVVTIQDLTKKDMPVIARLGDNIRRPSYVQWASDQRLLVTVMVPYNTSRVESKAKKDDFDIYDYPMVTRMIAVDVDGGNSTVLLNDSAHSN
jgi:hypothetical protein